MTQNELHDMLCVLYKTHNDGTWHLMHFARRQNVTTWHVMHVTCTQNELHDMLWILQDAYRCTWHVMHFASLVKRTTWHVMHFTRRKTNYMTCYASCTRCITMYMYIRFASCTRCITMYMTSYAFCKTLITKCITCHVVYKTQNELHDMLCIVQDA